MKMIKVDLFIFLLLLDHPNNPFQGDFHVVEYLGWETTYTEIVPSDRWDTFTLDHVFQPGNDLFFHDISLLY